MIIKNIKIKLAIFFLTIALSGIATTVHATLNIETNVDVPAACTATDTDGVVHNYPETNSYLAVCALKAAMEKGSVSSAQLSNQFPSLGLFVTAFNGVAADPNSQYWAIYQNGNFANSGITSLSIIAGDTIKFELHDFSDNSLGDQVILHINSLIARTPVIPAGSGALLPSTPVVFTDSPVPAPEIKPTFDIENAFKFLSLEQQVDGSFGEELYTDWAAIALASGNHQGETIKLIKYLGGVKLNGTLLTDFERHAMALMALGLNPYNTNGENYIEKITKSFDGKQFGEANEDNDDIFALLVLSNAGFSQNEKMLSDDITFIIGQQKENGSWDESVDMTAASIQALAEFGQSEQVKNALKKAKDFLKQNQKEDGGFGNVSATAWAMGGIAALAEKPEAWIKNNMTPLDYLAKNQDIDGGTKNENLKSKIWETSYVLAALSGKTWNEILQKFEKPEETKPVVLETKKPAPSEKVTKTPKPKNKTEEVKNLPVENTATVINALPQPKKNGWFKNLMEKIFGAI